LEASTTHVVSTFAADPLEPLVGHPSSWWRLQPDEDKATSFYLFTVYLLLESKMFCLLDYIFEIDIMNSVTLSLYSV